MKRILFIAIATLLFACNDTESTDNGKSDLNKCTYKFDENSIKLKWTAFKTTAKIPVSGTFDKVYSQGIKSYNTINEVIDNAGFLIETATVNSGDEARDIKLVEFFFGKLDDGKEIVVSVHEKTDKIITYNLILNGVTKQVDFKFEISDIGAFSINGTIDLNDFNAGNGVESINNACLEKHTGEDGVSKTWSTVDINIIGSIKKNC